MFNKTKIFLNETKPPKDTFDRCIYDFVDELVNESPLAGTNIGKQFGLKKEEPHEPIKSKRERRTRGTKE